MTRLDVWLKQATRHLSGRSAALVRAEIQEHYESAREAAINDGAAAAKDEAEADRLAVNALGNAATANRQYRKVLLTSAEAKMLRQANCEARAICSHLWLKLLILAIPAAGLLAAAALFLNGSTDVARVLLIGGIGLALLLAMPFLPIYTPSRSRVFRVVKCVLLTGALVFAFGPDMLNWSWLLISCLGPLAWTEWTRISIRRKLPVSQWPKHLYL